MDDRQASSLVDHGWDCLADVGDTGCGFEAPLEAMKRALDGSRPETPGRATGAGRQVHVACTLAAP
jgi:hypothetical protein